MNINKIELVLLLDSYPKLIPFGRWEPTDYINNCYRHFGNGYGQEDTMQQRKPSRGQALELLGDLNISWVSGFTDYWIRPFIGFPNLYVFANIYRSFIEQVCHYQFLCCMLLVGIRSDPRGAWAGRNHAVVCSALLDLHRGRLECLVQQCPGPPGAKNEGQPSLITTLKHYQHLFKPKTTLSPGINLLNHWIITLSRANFRQQEHICEWFLRETW